MSYPLTAPPGEHTDTRPIVDSETRSVRAVDYAEWRRLDAREVERGKPQGRPRVKFLRLEEMLLELGIDPAGVGVAEVDAE